MSSGPWTEKTRRRHAMAKVRGLLKRSPVRKRAAYPRKHVDVLIKQILHRILHHMDGH